MWPVTGAICRVAHTLPFSDYKGHQARYQAKIDKQLANVQDLTDHKVALATALFEPLPSPPTLDLLLERLDQVAEKQGTGKFASFSNRDLAEQVARLVPLPRAMNYGLPDESLDYISKLLTDFWTVGPLHPALVDSEAEEDKNKFKLYIRMRKTTVGALRQIIAKLKRTRPVNSPSLIAMEASLSGLAQDAVIYEKYIGETIRSSSERQKEDLHSASSSGKGGGKTHWLHRLSLLETTDEPFKVYHIRLNASVPSRPTGQFSFRRNAPEEQIANKAFAYVHDLAVQAGRMSKPKWAFQNGVCWNILRYWLVVGRAGIRPLEDCASCGSCHRR
jgi:hypothetical protein